MLGRRAAKRLPQAKPLLWVGWLFVGYGTLNSFMDLYRRSDSFMRDTALWRLRFVLGRKVLYAGIGNRFVVPWTQRVWGR